MSRPKGRPLALLLPLLVVLTAACSSPTVEAEPTVDDLVGTWDASELTFTSVSDPSQSVEVTQFGAEFFLDVQPSGGFTASLSFEGEGLQELGRLEVKSGLLIFHVEVSVTGPRVDTATFELSGDVLEFTGRTVFPFDLGGLGSEAIMDASLLRR